MAFNPQQLFIIQSVRRQDITSIVRDSLDWIRYKHPSGDQTIAIGDSRLTDEVCQKYADMIGEIDYVSDSCEFRSDQENQALRYVLEQLGFVECEENLDYEPGSFIETQLETIEWYKKELEKANNMIAKLTTPTQQNIAK